jgi:hypothetical protein
VDAVIEREWNLRRRIDAINDGHEQELAQVKDERDWYKARATVRQSSPSRPAWCVFCGARTKTRKYPAACRAHRDLVALDPFYSEEVAA